MSASLLRLPEVLQRTGFGRSSLYSYVKRGRFPAPVRLGDRCVAWRAQDVDDWIAARPQACACLTGIPASEGGSR